MNRRDFLRSAGTVSAGLALSASEMETSRANPLGNDDPAMLEDLRRAIVDYFLKETNAQTGLVADRTQPGSPSSIAAVGMGPSVYVVAVERGILPRSDAIQRTLKLLRFFKSSPQGPEADATGYKGFYYHFLDMQTGRRAVQCEVSTVDTAILLAGVLTAANYFTATDSKDEKEIRDTAEFLYRRVDWKWALDGAATLSHGWQPESGFLPYRWDTGYSEALMLYAMALGSPTFPIEPQGYHDWLKTFEWKKIYDLEYLYAGPLFIHQMSHLWIDFRGIRDDFNRKVGIDYFENSRRATQVHRQYAIANPHGFERYGEFVWGLTASDGPGDVTLEVNGVKRTFFDYIARGAPFGYVDSVRAGNLHPHRPPRHRRAATQSAQSLRIRGQFQSHFSAKGSAPECLDVALGLRPKRRPDSDDDRKLPVRAALEYFPPLPLHRERLATRGLPRRLARSLISLGRSCRRFPPTGPTRKPVGNFDPPIAKPIFPAPHPLRFSAKGGERKAQRSRIRSNKHRRDQ